MRPSPGDSRDLNRRIGVAALAARRQTDSNPLSRLAVASQRLQDAAKGNEPVPAPVDSAVPEAAPPVAQAVESAANSGPETAAAPQAASPAPETPPAATAQPTRYIEPLPPIESARAATLEQTKRVGMAAIAAANRVAVNRQANQVKDGFSLGVLSATSGAAAGIQQRSSGLLRAGDDRRLSLFDTPGSGQGLVNRLRAQVRPSSPLNALGSDSGGGPLSSLSPSGMGASPMGASSLGGGPLAAGDGPSTGLSSLTRANAQRASLGGSLLNLDNSSRRLLSTTSANRTSGGFGLASTSRAAIDLIG